MKALVILVSLIMVLITSIIIIKDAFESESKLELVHILYAGFIAFPVDDVAYIHQMELLGLAVGFLIL